MAAGMMAFAPSEVCAQGAFKRTLVSQDYELAESPDWSFFLGPTISLVTGDATYGNYVSLIQGGGSGNRNVYKYVEFQTTPDGYLEDLSTKGYVVEFDASFVDGNHNNGIAQFLLMTSSTRATNNNSYEGEDYIFALSQPTSTPYSESWYVNDLNNGGEPVTIASGLWHHFVITISASYVDYVITEIASGEIVAQGRKELAGSELPIIEGFRALLPRASSVYNFDNLVIYDYVAQQVATPPTIELTDINMNERTYTVTCAEGETLYYKLPGEDIFTEIEGKTSTEVTIGVSGVFSAYTMLGSSTSAVVEVNVVAEILKLNAPSYLRLGADSYYIIEASQDNIGFGPTAKLYYTINGGEAKDITGGGEITGVIGDLVVWASADGYGDSEVTIPYTPALQLSEVWAYDLDSYPRTTGITAISDAINPETKQTLNGLEVYNLSGINCPNLFVDNSSAWLLRNRTGNAFIDNAFSGLNFSVVIGIIAIIALWLIMNKTRLGLRLRACGENPAAADSVGINVYRMRYVGTAIGSSAAGLAGFIIFSCMPIGTWQINALGYGFLAIAIEIFGNWKATNIIYCSLFFAFFFAFAPTFTAALSNLGINNPVSGTIFGARPFYYLLPYLLALITLVIFSKKSRAPKAEGIPYNKSSR